RMSHATAAIDQSPQAAAAAGLRYVHDRQAGLHRRRTGRVIRRGKRTTPRFAIVDAAGHAVRDRAALARIDRLAIPPAWEHVWICPDERGHLQATGRDARG